MVEQRGGRNGRKQKSLHRFEGVEDAIEFFSDAVNIYSSSVTTTLVFGTREVGPEGSIVKQPQAHVIVRMSPQMTLSLAEMLQNAVPNIKKAVERTLAQPATKRQPKGR